jgi:GTP:adenosylcobinamide-phosphate guanylyltransferase
MTRKSTHNTGRGVYFTAVVLAADRRPNDPVARAAEACCKALSPVGGRPMLLRVLDALEASREITDVVLVGPPKPALEQNPELQMGIASGRFGWVENQSTPSASAYIAMQSLSASTSVLLTTADHALLSRRTVDYFCARAQASEHDLLVALAPYEQVSAAYPEVKRTVIKFRDSGYCSCNLFAFMTPRGRAAADFWRRVEKQRKNPFRVISALGWLAVLRYLWGRLTLSEALQRISRRLDLQVGAVIMPFPEAAIDVDTVNDWTIAQRIATCQTQTPCP